VGQGQDDRSLHGLRIVVVEDDPLSLEVLCQALEYIGARVAGVTSAADARALLLQSAPAPDVIITDIHLGIDTGTRLLDWLRALPQAELADVPVVAVTAYPRHAAEASAHAFADWLVKPLMMEQLRDAVHRAATTRVDRRAAS